jgi:signal transduction histidine kinase/CheY-like chemotaxis protein
MQFSQNPTKEEQRLQALYRYNILNTAEEHDFDNLIELAVHICNTPIAVITMAEKDKLWFKSKIGLKPNQTPRDIGLCTYTVNQADIFIVADTHLDERFKNNPLVTGDLNIRFYAGAPLITPDGHTIGTLCVMDNQPRELTQEQIHSLKTLSHQVITLLELRFHMKNLNSANAQLLEDQELLKKANKHKSEFLSNISHEIRTPLNSILGFSQLLRFDLEECNIPNGAKNNIDYIDQGGQHLLSIINDILDITKIEADKIEVNYTRFNLKELTDSIYQINLFPAKEANITLNYNFEGSLPADITSDRTKLSQVLMNLMSNAIKFTPAEGKVSFNISSNNHCIVFEVSDTGIGIAEDKLQSIFLPFEQVESSKSRSYDGTGLGLSISKKLIEFLDGEIQVVSQIHIGSSFTAYLPFKPASENISQHQNIRKKLRFNPAGKNILVVEDNPQNQEVIKQFLQILEINTKVVDTGDLAIEEVKTNTPDIIIMDIHLPGTNGFDATKIIHSQPRTKDAIIIALTADTHIEKEIEDAGFAAFLAKPLSFNALIDTLNEHLT